MGNLRHTYNAAVRDKLPRRERWGGLELVENGAFPAGRTTGTKDLIRFRPIHGGDAPHALVIGPSKFGKSTKMQEWSLYPWWWNLWLGADWLPTVIIDPKKGSSYDVARSVGCELVMRPSDIKKRLESILRDVERRNRILGEEELERADRDGFMRVVKAPAFHLLTPEQRQRWGLRPYVVMIDEMRDVFGGGYVALDDEEAEDLSKSAVILTSIVQKARSAGIIVIGGVQMARADIMGSFAREQMGARLIFGSPGPEGLRMATSNEIAKRIEKEAENLDPGHGYAYMMGGRVLSRIYSPEVEVDQYAAFAKRVPDTLPADWTDEVDEDGVPPSPEVSRWESALAERAFAAGAPARGWLWETLQDARAVVTGPFVRLGLRAMALRHLVGPLVEGAHYRSETVRLEAWGKSSGRCACCGWRGPLEVDHRRMLSARGTDTIDNVWTLCKRGGGKPSCHDAKTDGERTVRAIRKRAGTFDDGQPKGEPLSKMARQLIANVPVYRWWLVAAALVGLFIQPMILTVTFAITAAVMIAVRLVLRFLSGARLIPFRDHARRPTSRSQAWHELKTVEDTPSRFSSITVKAHHKNDDRYYKVTEFLTRVNLWYFGGMFGPFVLPVAVPLLWGYLVAVVRGLLPLV